MLTEVPSNVSIAPQDYQFGGSVPVAPDLHRYQVRFVHLVTGVGNGNPQGDFGPFHDIRAGVG